MTDRITLTEEERHSLGCYCTRNHGRFRFCPVPTVESILSARVAQAKAEALRDAAEVADRSLVSPHPRQIWRWLHNLANTYDPKSGDNE